MPESLFGFGQPEEEVEVTVETAASNRSAIQQCLDAGAADIGFDCIEVFYGTNRQPLTEAERAERGGRQSFFSRLFSGPTVAYDRGELFGRRIDSRGPEDGEDRPRCEPNPEAFRRAPQSSDTCHLGAVAVSVPFNRETQLASGDGSLSFAQPNEALTAKELQNDFALLGHTPLTQPEFMADVRDRLRDDDKTAGHAIVYVHGFNVPFRNAAIRAAQLKYDTGFDGPVMFFSWPANKSAFDYLNDQADADLSVDALVRFLRFAHETVSRDEYGQETGAKVHIIAHSMGTRVTAQALSRMADFESETMFGELIFAAGDLDHNLFTEWVGSSTHLVDGVTLYASHQDGAVQVSTFLRNLSQPWGTSEDPKFRIGFFRKNGTPQIYDFAEAERAFRVDTVDISPLAKNSLFGFINLGRRFVRNHAAYAENSMVTEDIIKLICDSDPEADPPYRPTPDERGILAFDDGVTGFWRARQAPRNQDRPVRPGCTPSGPNT